MGFHPQLTHADQPLVFQPWVSHPGLRRQRLRQMPIAFATDRSQDRVAFTRSQRQKIAHFRARIAPLFPVTHAHAAAYPEVEFGNRPVVVRDAEVTHPTSDVLGELVKPVGHRDAPASSGEFSDGVPEVREGVLRPTQFASIESKSQEDAVIGLNDLALLLVDHQIEFACEKARHARHHTFTRPLAFDENNHVYSHRGLSPHKFMPMSGVHQPMERTLPCCALQRRSSARYV